MSSNFFGSFNSSLQIADIVERIKNTHNINAVINRFFNKVVDNVIGIVAGSKHVLAAEKHLKFCVGHSFADDAQTFPGIFIQEAQAGVKGCPAPYFSGIKTNLIHSGKDWEHFVCTHTGGNQGLMRVAQNSFRNF